MPGPTWDDDLPADLTRISGNCASLLQDLRHEAPGRPVYGLAHAREWHQRIYDGCSVPARCYIGNFRGDPSHPELIDYEVGVGPDLRDGWPQGVGVWAADLDRALRDFERGVSRALATLDPRFPPGERPTTVDQLQAIVALAAEVHGEWVRLHPFANGNGRTARLWVAVVALRYGLPVFVRLRPRPGDTAYARAARASMGRPPDFRGSHSETVAVFSHLLSLALLR